MVLYTMRHRENLSKLDKAMKAVEGEDMLMFLKDGVKDIKGTGKEDPEEIEEDRESIVSHQPRTWGPKAKSPKRNPASPESRFGPQGDFAEAAAAMETGSQKSAQSKRSAKSTPKDDQWNWWSSGGWDWNEKGWDSSAGKWNQKGDEVEIVVPLTTKESLIGTLQKIAAKLPEGGKDSDLHDLLKLIAENWREGPLPSLLSGWHLLQRSQLTPGERATVVAAASMSTATKSGRSSTSEHSSRMIALQLPRIELALRTQWQDEELFARDERYREKESRREKGTKKGYQAEEYEEGTSGESDDEANLAQSGNEDSDSEQELNDGEALLAELSDEEEKGELQEALATMHDARGKKKQAQRTFVQARAVVRDIKKSRRFFRPRKANAAFTRFPTAKKQQRSSSQPARNQSPHPNKKVSGGTQKTGSSGTKRCFRCGSKDHVIAECSDPRPGTTSSSANYTAEERFATMADIDSDPETELKKLDARRRELERKVEIKRRLEELEKEKRRLEREYDCDRSRGKKSKKEDKDRKRDRRSRERSKKEDRESRSHRHKEKGSERRGRSKTRRSEPMKAKRAKLQSASPSPSRSPVSSRPVAPSQRAEASSSKAPGSGSQSYPSQKQFPGKFPEPPPQHQPDLGYLSDYSYEYESDGQPEAKSAPVAIRAAAKLPAKARPLVKGKEQPPAAKAAETQGTTREVSLHPRPPNYPPPEEILQEKGKGKGKAKGHQEWNEYFVKLRQDKRDKPAQKSSYMNLRCKPRHQSLPTKITHSRLFSPSPSPERCFVSSDFRRNPDEEEKAAYAAQKREARRERLSKVEVSPSRTDHFKKFPRRDRLETIYCPIWPTVDHRVEPMAIRTDEDFFAAWDMAKARLTANWDEEKLISVVTTTRCGKELPVCIGEDDRRLKPGTPDEEVTGDVILEKVPKLENLSPAPSTSDSEEEKDKTTPGNAPLTQVKEETADPGGTDPSKQEPVQPPATVAEPTETPEADVKKEVPPTVEESSLMTTDCSESVNIDEAGLSTPGQNNDPSLIIIDTGATGSLFPAAWLMKFGPEDALVDIDPKTRRVYRFGNGERATCSSTATYRTFCGPTELDVIEHSNNQVPPLLGIKYLQENHILLDLAKPALIAGGRTVKLIRMPNGHLGIKASDFFEAE